MAVELATRQSFMLQRVANLKKLQIPQYMNAIDPSKVFDYNRQHAHRHKRYTKGRFYVFMTKPDLNISLWARRNSPSGTPLDQGDGREFVVKALRANMENFPLMRLLGTRYPDVIKALTQPTSQSAADTGLFIKPVTNLAEGFTAVDRTSDPITYTETFTGDRMQSAKDSLESMIGGTFTLEFPEMSNMFFSYLMAGWQTYMDEVIKGRMFPKAANAYGRRFDYMVSVYCFSVAEDGSTLQFFSKYTGVFPISTGYSAFEERLGTHEVATLPTTWAYNRYECLNPEIIKDFNATASADVMLMADPTGGGFGLSESKHDLRPSSRAVAGYPRMTDTPFLFAESTSENSFQNQQDHSGYRSVKIVQKPVDLNERSSTENRNLYAMRFS